MSTGLLFDCDEQVAKWLFTQMGWPDYKFDRAVGLMTPAGQLIGAIIFQHWNGCNVEVSYYGRKTMSAGIMRTMAVYTLVTFNPSRLTVHTSKKNKRFIASLHRFGFKLEGTSRRYFGPDDCNRNTAVRFVAFREDIERVARFRKPENVDEPASIGVSDATPIHGAESE